MKSLTRFVLFIIGAIVLETIAMYVDWMHLPASTGFYFGIGAVVLLLTAVWEKPKPDERESVLAWQSSHYAFLGTATVLAGILLYQTKIHKVDLWLLTVIAAIVIGKIFGRVYAGRNS